MNDDDNEWWLRTKFLHPIFFTHRRFLRQKVLYKKMVLKRTDSFKRKTCTTNCSAKHNFMHNDKENAIVSTLLRATPTMIFYVAHFWGSSAMYSGILHGINFGAVFGLSSQILFLIKHFSWHFFLFFQLTLSGKSCHTFWQDIWGAG